MPSNRKRNNALHELRGIFKKPYGHYAPAVISLVGLSPTPEIKNAALRRNLAEVHALQIKPHRSDDPECEPFIGWDHAEVIPTWFSKPLPSIPRKLPILLPVHLDAQDSDKLSSINYFGYVAKKGEETARKILTGSASFHFTNVGKHKALVVHILEQATKGLKSREARQLEGWKNAAVQHLEQLAKQRGCKLILFNTAEEHSRANNADRPIHVELIETYGRLPMQHGFKLHPLRLGGNKAETLWWVKPVKK
ncbi:MAG: hypothetical protein Q8R15_03470 [Candidatus Micrarchaeota archaeon]|nr:hypothetical protein [Candidatus Micrarchaeota archaeon]